MRPWSAREALACGLLVSGAFALRALPWPTVLSPAGVHLLEPDAWYHLRRVVFALRTGEPLGFDPFLNFPHGATAIWPPLFDTAVATLLLPFVPTGEALDPAAIARVERLVVWIPPALGALAVLALYALVRRHFGVATALVSAFVLAVLPGGAWYARVGVLDHHVAVALLSLLLLAAGMELLRAWRKGGCPAPAALSLALLQALVLSVWPGALLQVSCVALGLVVFWLARPERAGAVHFGALLAAVFAVSALLLLAGRPPLPEHLGPLSPVAASCFQPLLLGTGALVTGVCALLWSRVARVGQGRRLLHASLLSLAVAGLALLLLPGLTVGLSEAFSWLARQEVFQESVLESRPLLLPNGSLEPGPALLRLSGFLLVAPLAWGVFVFAAWRGPRRPEHLLLAGYAAGLGAAALLQARFANSFAAPLAILFGWSAVTAWERAGARGRGGVPRRTARLVTVVLALALLAPAAVPYRTPLHNALARMRGDPVAWTREDRYWLALEEVAHWLREQTPPAGDPWSASGQPAYGVLGHWQTGHLLLYRGQRPVLVGNFGDDVQGDNYRWSFEYFRLPEEKAVELLDRLGARYVVVRPIDVSPEPLGGDALLDQLADPDVGGAGQHRLIYERRVLRAAAEQPRAQFRVFERVPGAEVVGRAQPGARVEARLAYVSPTGRKGRFARHARADARGHYRLRLPYATRDGPPGLVTAGSWQLFRADAGAPPVPVVVPERAVREGETLAGPDL